MIKYEWTLKFLKVRGDLYANDPLAEIFWGRMIQMYLFQTRTLIESHNLPQKD